jgi:hypothetical protein
MKDVNERGPRRLASTCLVFEDERTPAVDQVLDRVTEPALSYRHSGASKSPTDSATARSPTSCLPISLDAETNSFAWSTTLHLADRFKLSLYKRMLS